MQEPVRGKDPRPDVGTHSITCADDDLEFVSDYLRSNGDLEGPRLQAVLNRQRRRHQSPDRAGRGGLSRRAWKQRRAAESARSR